MLKKSLLALIFISTIFSLTGFAQTDELLEIISVDACDCIKKIPQDVDQESFGTKFEVCLTDYFNENAEMLSLYSESIDGDLDLSELGEEFGTKLGKKLINSCPIFLERITSMQEKAGSDFYEEMLEGNRLIQTQGCKAANEVYSKIIDANDQVPDSTLATTYNNRGYCKTQLGDYYGSISDLSKSIEIIPNFVLAHNNRGEAKRYLGDYKSSIDDYTKALEISPQNLTAYNGRGMSYYYNREYEKAQLDYQRALQIDSTIGNVYFNLGLLFSSQSEYVESLGYFKKAYNLNPDITDLSYYTAEVYTELELYNEAITTLLADSLTQFDQYNLNDVGANYYYLNKYDSALAYYDKSLKIDDSNYYTYLLRAYAYQDSGAHELAISEFDISISLDSTQFESVYYRGYSTYLLENYEEAIQFYNKAIELDSSQPEAFDFRARAKFKSENFKGAVDDFSSSLDLYPNDPNIYKERGEAYLKLEDKTKACADFSLAKQLGIDDEEDKELLENLMSENCSDD